MKQWQCIYGSFRCRPDRRCKTTLWGLSQTQQPFPVFPFAKACPLCSFECVFGNTVFQTASFKPCHVCPDFHALTGSHNHVQSLYPCYVTSVFCTSGNHNRPYFPQLRSFSRLPLLPLLSFVFLYRQTLSPSCRYSSHLPLPLSSCFSSPFNLSQIMPRHPFAMLSSINAITGFSPYSPLFLAYSVQQCGQSVDLYVSRLSLLYFSHSSILITMASEKSYWLMMSSGVSFGVSLDTLFLYFFPSYFLTFFYCCDLTVICL